MPLVNRTFDQLIDFTRTSAGTFVNSSGNIASTAQSRNLLTFTQEFNNAAWTKTNSQIVPNQNPAAASLGAELVTNGDFASGTTTGWGTANSTLSVVSGALRVTTVSTGTYADATQTIQLVAGRTYLFTFSGTDDSNGTGYATINGAVTLSATKAGSYYITAASTGSAVVTLRVAAPGSAAVPSAGNYVDFDNVSLREVIGGALQAPDGTFTADTIIATATATPALVRTFASTAAAHTFSIYLKQGNTSFSEIEMIDQGTVVNRVRLTYATGALTVVAGSPTGTATSVGNGWWRVTITYTFPAIGAADTLVVYPSTTTGSIGEYCFAWGAQLEQASSATDYTRNFGGLFPPRFDYDPVTRAPRGLLIEEQRTNLLTYSEDLTNAAWVKTGATVTANATTSPDGTSNADKLDEDGSTGQHFAATPIQSYTSGVSYTLSAYVKAAEKTTAYFSFANSVFGASTNATFNLATGTVSSASNCTATITNAGNGWYRCAISATATASVSTVAYIAISSLSSYTGTAGSGIFIYGAQLEAGAFATSYIPTVAAQVTRTADSAVIQSPNFASWFNNVEGTLLVEADSVVGNIAQVNRPAAFSDGGSNNTLSTYIFSALRGTAVSVGGVSQADLSAAGYTANAIGKWAFAYKVNDFALSVNGAAALTDTSGTVPTVDRLSIGSLNAINLLNGHIRSIRFYPTRLSNAQLQALTA